MSECQDFQSPCFVKPLCPDVLVVEGDVFTLEAAVLGSPTPDVYWYKDGYTVIEDDYHSFSFHPEGRCCLTINYVRDLDEGEYECRAKNDVGQASSFGGLRVQLIEKDRMKEFSPELLHLEDIPCEDIEGRQSGLFILFDEGSQDEDGEELKDYSALVSLSASEQIEGIIEDLTMAEGTASISLSREGVFISDESQDIFTEDKDLEMFKNKELNDGQDCLDNENANNILECREFVENASSQFKQEISPTTPSMFKTNGNNETQKKVIKSTLEESNQYMPQFSSNEPTVSSAFDYKVTSSFRREESVTSSIDMEAPIQITEVMSPTEVINEKEPLIREDSEEAPSKHSQISEEGFRQLSVEIGIKIEELEDDTLFEEKSEEVTREQEDKKIKDKTEDVIIYQKEQKDKLNKESKILHDDTTVKKEKLISNNEDKLNKESESLHEDKIIKKEEVISDNEKIFSEKVDELKTKITDNFFKNIETQEGNEQTTPVNTEMSRDSSDLYNESKCGDGEKLFTNRKDDLSEGNKRPYSPLKPRITELIIEETSLGDKNAIKDKVISSDSIKTQFEMHSSYSKETEEFKEIHEEYKTDKVEGKHTDISLEKDQDSDFSSLNARKLFDVDPLVRARRVLAECAAELDEDTFDMDFKSPFRFRHRLSADTQSDSGIGEDKNRSGWTAEQEKKSWFSENRVDDLREFSSKWKDDFEKEKKALLQEIGKSWPSHQKIWLDSHSSDEEDFEQFGLREHFNCHVRKDSKRSEDTLKDNDDKQLNSDDDTLASSKLDDEEMTHDDPLFDGVKQKISTTMEQELPGMSYSKTFETYSFNRNENFREQAFEYNRVTGRSAISKSKKYSFSESFDTDDSRSEPVSQVLNFIKLLS